MYYEPNVTVKIRKFSGTKYDFDPIPGYATPGSAGLDLIANIPEPIIIEPGKMSKIPTGIAISLPSPFYVGLVFARSGLSSQYGLTMINGVGVIDSDYTGEIICPIINAGQNVSKIEPGDRIAQLVICPISRVSFQLTDDLGETKRGNNGFGSTGIKKE